MALHVDGRMTDDYAALLPPGADLDADDLDVVRGCSIIWDRDGQSIVYRTGELTRRRFVESRRDVALIELPFSLPFAIAPDGRTIYNLEAVSHVRRHLVTKFDERLRP